MSHSFFPPPAFFRRTPTLALSWRSRDQSRVDRAISNMWPWTSPPALLAVAAILLTTASAQQCYFPDGSAADEYAPCGPNSPHCCYNTGPEYDDACFSNGMCFSWMMGYTYRGACTDQGWDESCVQECKGRESRLRLQGAMAGADAGGRSIWKHISSVFLWRRG